MPKRPNPPHPQFTRQTEIQAPMQPVTILETPSTTQIVDVAKEVEEAMKKTNLDFWKGEEVMPLFRPNVLKIPR